MQIGSLWINLDVLKGTIYGLKTLLISICMYYTALKITDYKKNIKFIAPYICIFIISILSVIIKDRTNSLIAVFSLIILLSFIFAKSTNTSIGYSSVVIIISLGINYIIFFIVLIVSFFISATLNVQSDFFNLIIISMIQFTTLFFVLKIDRIKYGISFLKKNVINEYFDIFILNTSAEIIFLFTMLSNKEILFSRNIFFSLIIFAIIMFITIQKSLQLYYKQKLLIQELKQTKQKLADKEKEVKDLETENINISKKNHTLAHKQKSLEYKIEEMMNKVEINKDEAVELKHRLKDIGKDLYKEKETIELDKTGITEIDDMIQYMQSECKKNKIDFELQLKGNIHHMINNFIAKEDLETLLADHIKNAIIAIKHTDNINKSILVRLGKIDETYGLYIYDSGIEFELETLKNLGKKPITTHANEGGTGMGFMNTFETLRKCNASLIIKEYNKPSKENYTKVLIIKFDNKNELKIESYRQEEIKK